jgi:hypothetical protein
MDTGQIGQEEDFPFHGKESAQHPREAICAGGRRAVVGKSETDIAKFKYRVEFRLAGKITIGFTRRWTIFPFVFRSRLIMGKR